MLVKYKIISVKVNVKMGATEEIMKMAKENNCIVTNAMVTAAGISREDLKYLVGKGLLEKSARSVYILSEAWDDEVFNLRSRFKRGLVKLHCFCGFNGQDTRCLCDDISVNLQFNKPKTGENQLQSM